MTICSTKEKRGGGGACSFPVVVPADAGGALEIAVHVESYSPEYSLQRISNL